MQPPQRRAHSAGEDQLASGTLFAPGVENLVPRIARALVLRGGSSTPGHAADLRLADEAENGPILDEGWLDVCATGDMGLIQAFIEDWLREVGRRLDLDGDQYLMAFILLERFSASMTRGRGVSVVRSHTLRIVFLACLVLALKVCCDDSVFAVDVCECLTSDLPKEAGEALLARVVAVEGLVCRQLHFQLQVDARTYAHYYYELSNVAAFAARRDSKDAELIGCRCGGDRR